MATPVEVPSMGESVPNAVLVKWHKSDGEAVKIDEPLCELETDKANVDIPAPTSGVLKRLKKEGDQVAVGEAIAQIEEGAASTPAKAKETTAKQGATAAPPAPPQVEARTAIVGGVQSARAWTPRQPGHDEENDDLSPAVRRLVQENHLDPASINATGPGGRITKEDVESHLASQHRGGNNRGGAAPAPSRPTPPAPSKEIGRQTVASVAAPTPAREAAMDFDAHGIHRAPMSKIRKRIAETLVKAQQTAAILTTFNEIDMTAVMELRNKYKERFQEVHGIGLGFMSFFGRAVSLALKEFPKVNAFLEGDDIVYHNYVNLGIAVSTDRGLAVPVLRNVEKMSFARIESEVKRVANAIRDGKLSLEELSGATFTITNGGVFGSLLSTPILTPPQSGILGMHAIQKRPMVIGEKIEVRSMMYVALSYDHRLVDGRESVSFLVRVKQLIEDPARLMLEV